MLSTSFSIYHLEFYLLIFARIAGVVSVAPFYGTRGVPRRIRIGLGLCIALVVASSMEYTPLDYTTIIGFTLILAKEIVLGLSVGFAATICLSLVNLTGMFIDREIGFSMVTAFDPMTSTNATITAEFYNYTVLLIMLCSNMHHFVISAICDTFQVIPVGGAIYNGQPLYDLVMVFMEEYFLIAFRIALPIFISITLCNIVLGVMAKTAPQMNMFSVGIELKLIVGLMVTIIMIFFLPNVTEFIQGMTENFVYDLIRTMY